MSVGYALRMAAALLLVCAVSSGSARAQAPAAEPGIPLPVLLDRERIAALSFNVAPQTTVLSATAPLQLSMGSDGTAELHWAGSIRRAAISLRNTGNKPVRDILILLRSTRGRIENIYDSSSRWRQTDHGWIAAVSRIDPMADIKIVVKYTLDGTGADRAGVRNELRAIVKPRESDAMEAVLSWNADDCAARYASRLGQLRAEPWRDPKTALQVALSREEDLPRRPLFGIDTKALDKEQRGALRLSESLLKTGGVDARLRSDEYKWLTGRLSRDLGNYLGQPTAPAMCAPAAPMLDYLQRRAAPLERRIDEMRKQRETWREHALFVARGALSDLAMQRLATSDPAMQLHSGTPTLAADYLSIVVQLGVAAGMSEQSLAALRSAGTPLQALQLARDTLADDPAFAATIVLKPRRTGSKRMVKVKEKNPRAAVLRAAFGAIERAAYLDLGAARLDALDRGFVDSLSAIRQANKESCACAY